jgi:ribonuclease P protein component
VLPRERRVRTPADFTQTLRSGARTGRRNLVVSAYLSDSASGAPFDAPRGAQAEPPVTTSAVAADEGSLDESGPEAFQASDDRVRVGFVVSKAVGNAVVRNRVKRRLRAAVAEQLTGRLKGHPGATVVVRALPPSGTAEWGELKNDLDSALAGALRKAAGRRRSGSAGPRGSETTA